ncbi:hypothetical protein OXX69_009632 [Metschnikowia pulcherrima]
MLSKLIRKNHGGKLRCSYNLGQLSRNISQNVSMGENEMLLDSSVNTMKKILTILHNAHGTRVDSRESVLDVYETDRSKFDDRFYESLGNDVLGLRTVEMLIGLQLRNEIDVFKDSSPNHTRAILQRYISAFKDQYMRESSFVSMASLGRLFHESPQRANTALNNSIKRIVLNATKDSPPRRKTSPLNLSFCRVNLYNPFRSCPVDPFSLRKGLSTKKHPSNLFSAMINDPVVIREFLRDLKKNLKPGALQNIMTAQSLSGELAFRIVVKRCLADTDPCAALDTPFEFYRLDIPDELSKVKKLKAIIASKSMLLKRLDWFPPYRRSIAKLPQEKFDSNEKVTIFMEDLFDRFFGSCYRQDPKYCQNWIKDLVEFQSQCDDDTLLDRLLQDSVKDFRSMFSGSSFNAFGARWAGNAYLNKTKSPNDRVNATRQLLKDARSGLSASNL